MGDSGALLLGLHARRRSRSQGLLKTAALATLVLPLLVLAVPVLDTSFVVAKRLRSGQPIYVADARHLHHRFMRIGFSAAARRRLPLDLVRRRSRSPRSRRASRRRITTAAGASRTSRSTSRPGCSRSPSRSTSSICSRSSSSRTRARGAARPSATRLSRPPEPTRHKRHLAAASLGENGVTSAGMLRGGAAPATDVLPRRGRQRADRIHGSVHRRRHADRLGDRENRLRARLRRSRRHPRRRRHDRDQVPEHLSTTCPPGPNPAKPRLPCCPPPREESSSRSRCRSSCSPAGASPAGRSARSSGSARRRSAGC